MLSKYDHHDVVKGRNRNARKHHQ